MYRGLTQRDIAICTSMIKITLRSKNFELMEVSYGVSFMSSQWQSDRKLSRVQIYDYENLQCLL